MFALKIETTQEMDFVREVDRSLARALMTEFVCLQLIIGEDLNISLQGMHASLEASANDLRDLDFTIRNSTEFPLQDASIRLALNCYNEMVKLKLALPLALLDAAHEDMEAFLQC